MKNIILATLALGVTALTSCTYDSYQTGGRPGPPPRPGYGGGGGPGHGNQSAEAYRRGQNDGARDKRNNRRFDPSRGQASVNPPFRDSYRNGYTAGYRSTGGGGHQGPGYPGGGNPGWGNQGGRPPGGYSR